MYQHRIALVLAVVASGCMMGGRHDMGSWATALHGLAFELRAEQEQHQRDALAAPDLSTLRALDAQHASAVALHLEQMRSMMSDMGSQCSHMRSGSGPDLIAMNGAMAALLEDVETHSSATAAAPDLAAAVAEETRHADAMGSMLDRMEAASVQMMAGAAEYSCMRGC